MVAEGPNTTALEYEEASRERKRLSHACDVAAYAFEDAMRDRLPPERVNTLEACKKHADEELLNYEANKYDAIKATHDASCAAAAKALPPLGALLDLTLELCVDASPALRAQLVRFFQSFCVRCGQAHEELRAQADRAHEALGA
jgi:hypothetical protein